MTVEIEPGLMIIGLIVYIIGGIATIYISFKNEDEE